MAPRLDTIKSKIEPLKKKIEPVKKKIEPMRQKLRRTKKKKQILNLQKILKQDTICLDDFKEFRSVGKSRTTYTFHFETSPGETIEMRLYLPSTKGPYPAMLFNYGIGPNVEFAYLAKYITRGGWAVLVPAYRGCIELQPIPDDVDKVAAAFTFLRKLDIVKPNRVGIVGGSYGAALTVCGAAHRRVQNHVRYVVSIDGPADIKEMLMHATSGSKVGHRLKWILKKKFRKMILESIRDYKKKRGENKPDDEVLKGFYKDYYLVTEIVRTKNPDKIKKLYRQFSPHMIKEWNRLTPIKHIHKIKAPVLFVHGSDDTMVPAEQSHKLHEKRLRLGLKSDIIIIEGLGHGIMVGSPRKLVSFLRHEGRSTLKKVTRFIRR